LALVDAEVKPSDIVLEPRRDELKAQETKRVAQRLRWHGQAEVSSQSGVSSRNDEAEQEVV